MADEAKYFVYALADPLTNKIFYIGKGCGKRPYAHLREFKNLEIINTEKHRRIEQIISSGEKVIVKYLKKQLSETAALIIEKSYIEKFKHRLTNISYGEQSNIERQLAHTQSMIDRLIPFDEWVSSKFRTVIDIAYYDYVVNSLFSIKSKLIQCH